MVDLATAIEAIVDAAVVLIITLPIVLVLGAFALSAYDAMQPEDDRKRGGR